MIEYSCNGAHIPDAATTLTCVDNLGPNSVWETLPLPTCSKYNTAI